MAPISLTALRSQLFKLIDEAISTGIPIEIERKGHRLKIVPEGKKKKLENIKPHDCIVGNPDDLLVSEFSRLEIQYLYEMGRITAKPATILTSLAKTINLRTGDCPIEKLINEALNIGWTRDLFDRLLISEAKVTGSRLITADKKIRSHFENAVW